MSGQLDRARKAICKDEKELQPRKFIVLGKSGKIGGAGGVLFK
jgi:hypothetical protein